MTAPAPRPAAALLGLTACWGYASGVHGSIAPLLARSFALGDAEVAALFAWLGLASLIALAVGRAADRIGRRRALLGCATCLPLAAAASALAPGPRAYLAAQLLAFGVGTALFAVVTVVVAEESSPAERARGQARAGLALAIGSALPLLAAALLGDREDGWRGVWALGAVPLLALPWLARHLPESRGARAAAGPAHSRTSRRRLPREQRAHALRALGAVLAIQGAEAAARAFLFYHPVRSLGLDPRHAGAVLLLGGGLGLAGFRLGGGLADTRGRRPALLAGGALFALGVAGYYGATPPPGSAGLAWLAVSLAALAGGGNAALTTFRTHAAELLPAPVRGTFGGLLAVGGALGWSLAMLAVAALSGRVGGVGHAVTCVVLVALPVAALLMRGLPETGDAGAAGARSSRPDGAASLPVRPGAARA